MPCTCGSATTARRDRCPRRACVLKRQVRGSALLLLGGLGPAVRPPIPLDVAEMPLACRSTTKRIGTSCGRAYGAVAAAGRLPGDLHLAAPQRHPPAAPGRTASVGTGRTAAEAPGRELVARAGADRKPWTPRSVREAVEYDPLAHPAPPRDVDRDQRLAAEVVDRADPERRDGLRQPDGPFRSSSPPDAHRGTRGRRCASSGGSPSPSPFSPKSSKQRADALARRP